MQSDDTQEQTQEQTQTTDLEPGMQHLGELLDEQEPKPDDQEQQDDQEPPKKFNDLAKRLGMELDDLYKLEVSQAEDGSAVTIEMLKDRHQQHVDLELRSVELGEQQARQEAALLRSQEEIRELLAALPDKAVTPEVLQKIRAKHDAQVKLERARTLDAIPDWQDEKTRTADLEAMSEHLMQYGFPMNHLEHVVDHRQVKYIRDNWLREQRIRKALEKVRAGKPDPKKPTKPAKKAPSKQLPTGVARKGTGNKLRDMLTNLE